MEVEHASCKNLSLPETDSAESLPTVYHGAVTQSQQILATNSPMLASMKVYEEDEDDAGGSGEESDTQMSKISETNEEADVEMANQDKTENEKDDQRENEGEGNQTNMVA